MTLNIAFNYGARGEIVDAVKSIYTQVLEGRIKADDINENLIASHLYTKGQPDPDLLIRTSGEMRISNFLLWQLSYVEIYFTDKYWPEFNEEEFLKALASFAQRERRWGRVKV
jgi:undecaprenyl diphosphate synthase